MRYVEPSAGKLQNESSAGNGLVDTIRVPARRSRGRHCVDWNIFVVDQSSTGDDTSIENKASSGLNDARKTLCQYRHATLVGFGSRLSLLAAV